MFVHVFTFSRGKVQGSIAEISITMVIDFSPFRAFALSLWSYCCCSGWRIGVAMSWIFANERMRFNTFLQKP